MKGFRTKLTLAKIGLDDSSDWGIWNGDVSTTNWDEYVPRVSVEQRDRGAAAI